MSEIIVGSRAFFSGMEGFSAHDCDTLVLTQEPDGFEWRQEFRLRGNCRFTYLLQSPAEMVQRTLDSGEPLLVGKFLVPEVAEAIGATVADILPLEPLLEKLDDKHRYVAVIFEAVKTNGSFTLTDEQRAQAYETYKAARDNKLASRDKRSALKIRRQYPDTEQPDDEKAESEVTASDTDQIESSDGSQPSEIGDDQP